MNQEHHNKIMLLVGVLVVAVIIILGFVAILGHKRTASVPSTPPDTRTDQEHFIDMTTTERSTAANDPVVTKFNASTTAPANGRDNGSRAAFVEATTGR